MSQSVGNSKQGKVEDSSWKLEQKLEYEDPGWLVRD